MRDSIEGEVETDVGSVAVSLRLSGFTDDRSGVSVLYKGSPEALLSAGCVTVAMMRPGTKGIPRMDEVGRRFTRYRAGKKYVVTRWWPLSELRQLPGISREAIKELERQEREPVIRQPPARQALPSNIIPIRPGLKWNAQDRITEGGLQLAEEWEQLSAADRGTIEQMVAVMLRRQRQFQH